MLLYLLVVTNGSWGFPLFYCEWGSCFHCVVCTVKSEWFTRMQCAWQTMALRLLLFFMTRTETTLHSQQHIPVRLVENPADYYDLYWENIVKLMFFLSAFFMSTHGDHLSNDNNCNTINKNVLNCKKKKPLFIQTSDAALPHFFIAPWC